MGYAAFESIHAKNWYIYTIIGIVIVAIARWRHLRTTAFYKNGYEPIRDPKAKQKTHSKVEEEEATKKEKGIANEATNVVVNENEEKEEEQQAEYTHIDSMQSFDSNRSNKSNRTTKSLHSDSTLEIVD